jgi:seryl-tRNA synthetase
MCCILENYQTAEGVVVPEVLRKYIPGRPEFLPFVRDLPRDSTSTRAKGKTPGPKPKAAEPGQAADKIKELKLGQQGGSQP